MNSPDCNYIHHQPRSNRKKRQDRNGISINSSSCSSTNINNSNISGSLNRSDRDMNKSNTSSNINDSSTHSHKNSKLKNSNRLITKATISSQNKMKSVDQAACGSGDSSSSTQTKSPKVKGLNKVLNQESKKSTSSLGYNNPSNKVSLGNLLFKLFIMPNSMVTVNHFSLNKVLGWD